MSIPLPPTSSCQDIPSGDEVSGAAALAICESLLLALNDRKVLPEDEIMAILHDAAAAHANATGDDGQMLMHQGAADLINRIIDGGNSVRRT